AFLAQALLDEVLHLAPALADETDDDDVRVRVARHHAEQHALADAGPGEQSHALPASDGEQRVDGAYADVERLADRLPLEGVDAPPDERHRAPGTRRRQAVE